MASTSGGNSWLAAGESALAGVLSYESGQATSVPQNSGGFTNPDIPSLYYGQNQLGQSTVGALQSSGSSTLLILGVLAIAAVAFFALRR